MVTNIYLIRHGQTVDSDEKKYKGHIDVPLSAEGIDQISSLAAYLSKMIRSGAGPDHTANELDSIYCSDLSRAVKSAGIIAEPFGLKPAIDARLKERSFGKWEGMTFSEIQKEFPDEFDAWVKNPMKNSPPGGESTEDVIVRVMPVFNEIVRNHENRHVAIVSHGGVNRVILCTILGIPLEHIFRVEQEFAGLNIISFYDEKPVMKMMNFTAHRNGLFLV